MGKPSVTFKEYNQGQIVMLPPSLNELIGAGHPVRVVNEVIDRINLQPLLDQYKGAAHPVTIPKCCSRYWCMVT